MDSKFSTVYCVFMDVPWCVRSDITYATHEWHRQERITETMAASERVVFSFDPTSLETLNQVKEKGEFSSLGMAVRESLQLNDFFQNLVDKGFSEIVVRNPDTQQEKTIVISSLQKLADKKARRRSK